MPLAYSHERAPSVPGLYDREAPLFVSEHFAAFDPQETWRDVKSTLRAAGRLLTVYGSPW